MIANYDQTIRDLLKEIKVIAKALPGGKARQIHNRCDKVAVALRKASRADDTITGPGEGQGENEAACNAIYAALLEGRRLSQMDVREFRVEEMRTPVSHLTSKIREAGYDVRKRWITSSYSGRKIKEYWVVKKEGLCEN